MYVCMLEVGDLDGSLFLSWSCAQEWQRTRVAAMPILVERAETAGPSPQRPPAGSSVFPPAPHTAPSPKLPPPLATNPTLGDDLCQSGEALLWTLSNGRVSQLIPLAHPKHYKPV